MDVYPLDDLIQKFGRYQSAVGRAEGTTERYCYTFLLFGRFLDAVGLARTSAVLTSSVMERFAIWLRETPINPQHGKKT